MLENQIRYNIKTREREQWAPDTDPDPRDSGLESVNSMKMVTLEIELFTATLNKPKEKRIFQLYVFIVPDIWTAQLGSLHFCMDFIFIDNGIEETSSIFHSTFNKILGLSEGVDEVFGWVDRCLVKTEIETKI